jgi:hypothetical protein
MATESLRTYKSPGAEKFQQNWLRQEVGQYVQETHKLNAV